MDEKESSELIRVVAVKGGPQGAAWSFAVPRGGALWIPADEDGDLAWLDWLTGIEPPPAGEVFWKGVEWRARGPAAAAAERGRMGCVFASGGLVANLDMDENVWLPARMHRREGAEAAVEKWARFFRCWPLPAERAPAVRERDRRRILWARAFAGGPEALVLERPVREMPAEDRALFLKAVNEVRAAGCAVVWLEETLEAETQAALAPLARAAPEAM
jgi:predicted ABC-type transport system involved in lysophospholipase L1 biosynthesis ATPase subunit